MTLPTLIPEVVFHIGALGVTNTMINAFLATLIFLTVGLLLKGNTKLKPGKLQNFFEYILELLFGYFDQVTGSRKKTLSFLPIVGSVFFFILLSNWLGLLPGTGSLSWGGKEILRPANTDLNLTVAMALVAVISSHIFGFLTVGFFAYVNKFIQIGSFVKSIKHGPIAIFTALIEFVVGLLEMVSEAAKVLSLSLRLFGNIFAGEVLMTVIASIAGLLVPTPFMMLELLVGLIQASVFAMLTLVYLSVATMELHGSSEEH